MTNNIRGCDYNNKGAQVLFVPHIKNYIIIFMRFNENELYEKLGLQTQTAGFDTTNTLYMKALQLTRSKRRAQDLLMDTITDIYEKGIKGKIPCRDENGNETNLVAYGTTLLKNKFIDQYRKKGTSSKYTSNLEYHLKEERKNFEGPQENALIVNDCLAKLSDKCREILSLKPLYTQTKIGRKLKISQGEVARRISKCLKILTKLVNGDEEKT